MTILSSHLTNRKLPAPFYFSIEEKQTLFHEVFLPKLDGQDMLQPLLCRLDHNTVNYNLKKCEKYL